MRNLTIKRTKSFVGCISKVKIYIEDPTSTEITINHVPCRKIGELKNGEEKTFQIDEREAKVFVIADKLSKDFCNEYYQLAYGQEDIYLSGRPKYNPAAGNAFRFDNNENADVVINRKKGTKKGIVLLLIAFVVGAIIGFSLTSGLFSNKTPEAKTFTYNEMSITLTDEFIKEDFDNFDATFDSRDVAVFVIQDEFSLFEGFEGYTLKEYCELVIDSNALTSVEIETGNGLTYFVYQFTNTEANEDYQYYTYVYKTDNSFWMVQFAVFAENAGEYEPQIEDWASSVSFSD